MGSQPQGLGKLYSNCNSAPNGLQQFDLHLVGIARRERRSSSHKSINVYKYPIGKLRAQPVSIIIFDAVMAILGFQVFIQAIEKLTSNKLDPVQLLWLYSIMIFATVVLPFWLYCQTSGNKIVCAYAKDHYFDVVPNVVGLATVVLGDKFYWWIDPIGPIVLAVYTISIWSGTVWEMAGLCPRNSTPAWHAPPPP